MERFEVVAPIFSVICAVLLGIGAIVADYIGRQKDYREFDSDTLSLATEYGDDDYLKTKNEKETNTFVRLTAEKVRKFKAAQLNASQRLTQRHIPINFRLAVAVFGILVGLILSFNLLFRSQNLFEECNLPSRFVNHPKFAKNVALELRELIATYSKTDEEALRKLSILRKFLESGERFNYDYFGRFDVKFMTMEDLLHTFRNTLVFHAAYFLLAVVLCFRYERLRTAMVPGLLCSVAICGVEIVYSIARMMEQNMDIFRDAPFISNLATFEKFALIRNFCLPVSIFICFCYSSHRFVNYDSQSTEYLLRTLLLQEKALTSFDNIIGTYQSIEKEQGKYGEAKESYDGNPERKNPSAPSGRRRHRVGEKQDQ